MFDFRIIDTEDGNQVIRRDLKTPYSALTPLQYIEYTNMEVQLYIADKQKKKFLKESERRRKLAIRPGQFFESASGHYCGW